MLTRRNAIIAILAAPLGKFTAFAQTQAPAPLASTASRARLTINLDQWAGIVVTHGKRSTTITSAEIFDALTVKE